MATLVILLAVQFLGQTLVSMATAPYLKPTADQPIIKPRRTDAIGIMQTASLIQPLTELESITHPLSTSEISPTKTLDESLIMTSSQTLPYRRSEYTHTPLMPSYTSLTSLEHSNIAKTSLKPMPFSQLKLITSPLTSSETSSATASESDVLRTMPTKPFAITKLELVKVATPLTSAELLSFTTLEYSSTSSSSVHPLTLTKLELIATPSTPYQTSQFQTPDFSATASKLFTPLSYIMLNPSTAHSTEPNPVSFRSIGSIATPLTLLKPLSFIMVKTASTLSQPLSFPTVEASTTLSTTLKQTSYIRLESSANPSTLLKQTSYITLEPSVTPSTLLKQTSYITLEPSVTPSTLLKQTSYITLEPSVTPSTLLKQTSYITLEPSANPSTLQRSGTPQTSIQPNTNPLIQETCTVYKSSIRGRRKLICHSDLPRSIPVGVNDIWFSYRSLNKEKAHLPTNIPGSEKVTKITIFRGFIYNSGYQNYISYSSKVLYCYLKDLFPAVHTVDLMSDHFLFAYCPWPTVTRMTVSTAIHQDALVYRHNRRVESLATDFSRRSKSPRRKDLLLCSLYGQPCEWLPFEINMDYLQASFPKLEILKFVYASSVTIRFLDNGYCQNSSKSMSVYIDLFFSHVLNIIDETHCKYKSIEFNNAYVMQDMLMGDGNKIRHLDITGFNVVIFHDVDLRLSTNRNIHQNRRIEVQFVFTYNSTLQITSNKIKIFNFHTQQNKLIRYLCKIMNSRHIYELDLSLYRITYLSFTSFKTIRTTGLDDFYLLKKIQNISLANNELGSMANQNKENWSRIFHAFPLLSRLDLSINGISYLPENIFTFNPNITHIKLARNKLKYIPFRVFSELLHLEVLDISYNNIKLINVDVRQSLTLLSSLNENFELNISGNALECTCIDLDTYTWISDSRKSGYLDFNESTCLTADNIILELNGIEKYCSHQTFLQIIRYSMGAFGGVIVLMTIIVILVWRLRARQRKIAKYLNNVKNKRSKKEHVLFLSHCSPDTDIVYAEVLPNIQRQLIHRTHVDREYICTGDLHFKPGFHIIQEAIRCIDLCSIVVFVISKAFVKSPFCRMEVKEALDRAKPVILIMKEKIQQHKMPRIIKNLFHKNVRFHLVRCDHGYQVTPSWDRLVDAILELAADEEQDIETLELLREEKRVGENPDNGMEMRVIRGKDDK